MEKLDFSVNNICNKSINGLKIAVCKTMDGTIAENDIDDIVWRNVQNGVINQKSFKRQFCVGKLFINIGTVTKTIKYIR